MAMAARFGGLALASGAWLGLAAGGSAEEMTWFGDAFEDSAYLGYGIANSDYAPLSFWCEKGSGTVQVIFEFEPVDGRDGVEIGLLLQAGGVEIEVATIGERSEMDDLFMLTGEAALDARFVELITAEGELNVHVEDGAEAYPLAGAGTAAQPLLDTCVPA